MKGGGKKQYKYICNPNILTNSVKDLCIKSDYGNFDTIEQCAFSDRCIENFRTQKRHLYLPIKFSEMRYDNTYKKDGVLICMLCGYTILEQAHNDKCITVNMYQKVQINLSEFKKPMMTYGLGGCTAIIIKTLDLVIMAHHPEQRQILQWIMSTEPHNIQKLYIRLPEEYEQTDTKKYELKSTSIFDDIKYDKIIERYTIGSNNIYDSTLYCKIEDSDIKYTNSFGKWSIL